MKFKTDILSNTLRVAQSTKQLMHNSLAAVTLAFQIFANNTNE